MLDRQLRVLGGFISSGRPDTIKHVSFMSSISRVLNESFSEGRSQIRIIRDESLAEMK